MSHSVFKEQKCCNFRTAFCRGFPVEAADNLPELLMVSTRCRKKVFIKNILLKFAITEATTRFKQGGL
jgi:hypothetical protein